MTAEQLQRIMNGFNSDDKKGFMVDTFITETREGFNQVSDTVEYDHANELIKIKKYDYEIASGALDGVLDGKILKDAHILGSKNFEYRKPKTGDKIILIRKDTGAVTMTDKWIVKISNNEVELSGPVSTNNKYIGYTSEHSIDGLSAMPMQPFTLIKKFPISKHPYDVYLDINKVVAIEMVSMTLGSSGY